MPRYIFRLPDVGEGVAEAEVVVWHVRPGDMVAEDQSLVDVMTDKATVDMTSPVEGTVIAIHGAVGETVAVGSPLVEMEIADAVGAGVVSPATDDQPKPAPTGPASETRPTASPSRQFPPLASPSTRRRARERGISLEAITGSGPNGRILVNDLDAYAAHAAAPAASVRDGVVETKIVGLRRRIAEKMQEAKRQIPHISYIEECDLTELEALRADLNTHRVEGRPKLTLLPFFLGALVKTLPHHPQMNARYDDEAGVLRAYEAIHVGIATQTDAGLMVPVIRHAEAKDIWALAGEIARLSAAARDGSIARDELSGSTITVTSLGPLGGIATTPVINRPEVAIVGPNKLIDRPVVSGAFVSVRKIMNLSSSFDHRIVDGYDAAVFVQHVKRLLEHPALMFMD